MSIAHVGNLGIANATASGNTLVLTTSAALEAGNSAIIDIAMNNVSTVDAETSEISSITDSTTVNTWTKLGEYCNGNGAAAAGATNSLWLVNATSTLNSGGTITINFANSITARAATVQEFTRGAALELVPNSRQVLPGDAAQPGSMSISGMASAEYLFFRGLAWENSSLTFTPTATFTGLTQSVASGGGDSMVVDGEFLIATATGATSNPGANQTRDSASVFFALREARPRRARISRVSQAVNRASRY